MKPKKIRNVASALILFSLISVSLVTGTGNAAPQKSSVTLSARITDEGGTPIPGAHISIFQGEQHLGQGDADARGIVQKEIAVNAGGSVELVLEVSKPGMVTKAHKMKLGTSFPARLPLEEIQLKTGASRSGVVLTVKVTNEQGAAIQQALVNLYFKSVTSWTLADVAAGILNSLPRDLQETTGVNGMAQFNVPLRVGESKSVAIEVSREDKQTEVRTIQVSPASLDRMETFELKARPGVVGEGFPSANIKVPVVDQDGANLEGALVTVSSSAWTPSVSSKPHQKSTGPDGAATIAVELMSADPTERFYVLVSKPGYKRGQPGQSTTSGGFWDAAKTSAKNVKDKVTGQNDDGLIEIDNKSGKAKGKTFEARPVMLIKAPTAIDVKVVVLDGDTNNGVPDAEVILDGPDYATVNTDTAGVAPLSVEKDGTYKVRISQDYYWPAKDAEIRIKDGVVLSPAEFRLRRKATKDAAEDTIDITVLGKDSLDDTSPRPLKGAAVTDGRGTLYTDEQGKVTLRGAFDRATEITVSATDHKSQTKRVPINKAFVGKNTGSATVVLEPVQTEQSPIRLIVEVRDAARPDNKLRNVEVNLLLQQNKDQIVSRGNTGTIGETPFELRDSANMSLTRLRTGITIDAWRDGYERRYSDITSLQPSLEVQRVTVYLVRDWSAIRKPLEALEPKVFAWQNDVSAVAGEQNSPFSQKAFQTKREAERWFDEIYASYEAIRGGQLKLSLCKDAAPFLMSIPSYESQAKQKAQELKQNIDHATTLTKTCSTVGDAAMIRGEYRRAIKLIGEIGALNNKAVRDRDALAAIAVKNSSALNTLKEMKQKLAAITSMKPLAQENLNKAQALRETLIQRQLALKAEAAVVSVKAFSDVDVPDELRERITNLDAILRGANKVQPLSTDVLEAPLAIKDMEYRAIVFIREVETSTCTVPTLENVVSEINKILTDATFEIALAADLPKLGDACEAKAVNKKTGPDPTTTTQDKDGGVQVQSNPNTDKQPVVDPPKDNTTSDPNQPVVDPPKNNKASDPNQPANQPTTSGGFWDAAKKGKQNVVDKITNTSGSKPGANKPGPTAGNTGNNSKDPANKSKSNTPLTVEDIPEDTKTTTAKNKNKSNNPLTVEEIPEDSSNTTATKNKNKSNNPLTVEEIPEDSSNTTATNNRNKSNNPLTVEEIPESASSNDSNSATNSASVNDGRQGIKRDKTGKKPGDLNKTDIGTRRRSAREGITGQPNPGVTNNPGSGGGGGGGVSAAGLKLAGTWSVTTQSTGDDELQQNWTRTNVWHIWDLGGGRWRVRQVINGQTYDEVQSTVDYGGGSFRLISTFMGDTVESSGTYNQSQFQVSSSQGQNRITITGTRQ